MKKTTVAILVTLLLVATLGYANDFTVALGTYNAQPSDEIVCGHIGSLPVSLPYSISYQFRVNDVSQLVSYGNVRCGGEIPNCQKGDNLSCTIFITKGANTYSAVSNNLTIQNTPPTIPVINVNNPAPAAGQNLACNLLFGSTDADGDTLQYYYAWESKERPQDAWQFYDSGVGSIADVPSSDTKEGEYWRCSLYVTDGQSIVYAEDATLTVQETTRDAVEQDQWYVAFGKYDAEANKTLVDTDLRDRSQIVDPTSVKINEPFAFSYRGVCMFAECGDTSVEAVYNSLPIPYASPINPLGIYTYTFNPQDKDDYYPTRETPLLGGQILALGQSSCLESMKDTAAYRECTTNWIGTVNAALGSTFVVNSQWCSTEYPNDVRCFNSESLTFSLGILDDVCVGITGLSLIPPFSQIGVGNTTTLTLRASYLSGPDQVITSDPNVTWTNSNPTAADRFGLSFSIYEGLNAGNTTVTANFCGFDSSANISVISGDPLINYSRLCQVESDEDAWLQRHYEAEFSDGAFNLMNLFWGYQTGRLTANIERSADVGTILRDMKELDYVNIKDFFGLSGIKPFFFSDYFQLRFETIWGHEGFVLQRKGATNVDTSSYTPIYSACRQDLSDTALCRFQADCAGVGCCVYNGNCYAHGTTMDVDADKVDETCRANSPGIWVENGTGVRNQCSGASYSACSEDGSLYGAAVGAQSYVESPESFGLYCAWPVGASDWQWTNVTQPPDDLNTFDTVYPEECGDGYGVSGVNIDNNCNAFKVFESTAPGVYDFTRYIEGNETYDVYEDVDAFDPFCHGQIGVTVIDGVSGLPLENATVQMSLNNELRTDKTYRSVQTNSSGQVLLTALPATSYKFIATQPGYAASSIEYILGYQNSSEIIISLQKSQCTDTCVRSGVDIAQVCDLSCDGINGCRFTQRQDTGSGDLIKNLLGGIPQGAQIEYIDSGNGNTYTVNTCEGEPQLTIPGAEREAEIACDGGDIALVDTIVLYQGKPVKLKVVTCR